MTGRGLDLDLARAMTAYRIGLALATEMKWGARPSDRAWVELNEETVTALQVLWTPDPWTPERPETARTFFGLPIRIPWLSSAGDGAIRFGLDLTR